MKQFWFLDKSSNGNYILFGKHLNKKPYFFVGTKSFIASIAIIFYITFMDKIHTFCGQFIFIASSVLVLASTTYLLYIEKAEYDKY